MHKEKIKDAINSATTHLENSMQALVKNNDEKAIVNSLWLASSETEYALFLFSLMHPEKSESSPWKQSSQSKQVVDVNSALASAQSLLREAKSNIEAGATEKAYEEAWTARNMLLKVQEFFDKKRKSATAQPTPPTRIR
jgi:hypothetical protein